MDLNKFSQSLEHIIYDFLMWVIFFPYAMAKTLFNPLAMTRYAASELERDDQESRFNGLSPPFFLFLCVFGAWALSHPPTMSVGAEAANSVAGQILASPQNLIFFRLIVGCTYPLLGSLVYEWLTPGGITHASFRLPFYQQAYICAPFTLIASIASSYRTLSTNETVQGVAGAIGVAITIWFIIAQTRYFKANTRQPWWKAALLAFCILAIGWSVGLGAAIALVYQF